MKKFFTIVLTMLFLFFAATTSFAEEISAERAGWLSYEEYFSENRLLPKGQEYKYSYTTKEGYIRPDKYSQVNGEYCNNFIGYNADNVGGSIVSDMGTVTLKKKAGNSISEFYLGDEFLVADRYCYLRDCCGYMYTLSDTELCRWNKATLERETIYVAAKEESIDILSVSDELIFFQVGTKIYRYYAPSRTLDMVLENDRVGLVYPTENNIIVIQLYSEEFVELMTAAGWNFKDETALSRHPKDFDAFYAWANKKYSLNLTVPSEEEKTSKYHQLTIESFLKSIGFKNSSKTEGYDLKSQSFIDGYVTYSEVSMVLPTDQYNPAAEGFVPLPDVPSPWLGNAVEGLPAELRDEMALVPTGAYWGEAVNQENLLYTSLGNNQARALLSVLMEQKNIVRPEKRELLTVEAQMGKERISVAEVKATFESLYGVGSAETIMASDVIGDANAGDMLLKTVDGDYVYCWAPYAGSELNAEQYIKYLSHETDGEILTVDTAYGYYRLDDGRETYKLYGDARTLRFLETQPTEPVTSGSVNDGILTKLRKGELDDRLTVYRHTFRQNADGSYYWVSSAPRSQNTSSTSTPVDDTQPSLPWGIWLCIGCSLAAAGMVCGVILAKKKHG